MQREKHTSFRTNDERSNNSILTVESDAVVIGSGILGLLIAKRLVDFGQTVAVVDESPTIAQGASIKNHGWVHTGTVHSLSVEDEDTAVHLVKKLQYGYSFYKNYAQECIEDPFIPTYAITNDPELAQKARERWSKFSVPYVELTSSQMIEIEPGLNQKLASYFFESQDTRINNRLLFKKLFTEIRRSGGIAFTGAEYDYDDEQTIRILNKDGIFGIKSPQFFYATGVSLSDSHEKLTGQRLNMEFWKSHLLLLPRFTSASIVSMDRNAPIIINHGNTSVVNRSYDEYAIDKPDWEIDDKEVKKAFEVIGHYYPAVVDYEADVRPIACMKPDVTDQTVGRHSVNEKIYEPVKGHIFALPGKMTEAPYVADIVVRQAYGNFNLGEITQRPIDHFLKGK